MIMPSEFMWDPIDPMFQYFYHVSDRRVQCAIGTENPETTVFFINVDKLIVSNYVAVSISNWLQDVSAT